MCGFWVGFFMVLAICCGYVLETAYETLRAKAFKCVPAAILGARATISVMLGLVSFVPACCWVNEKVKHDAVGEVALGIFFSTLLFELIITLLVHAIAASQIGRPPG